MKPLDARLLRYARATWVHIATLTVLGSMMAALVIAEAGLLASAIAAAFQHRATLGELRGTLLALAAVLAGRVVVAWAAEALSYRASAAVKSELRRRVLAHAVALGPRWLAGRRTAALTTLATSGIDALDGYFARYLPQLVLAVIVPVAVMARIGLADPVSGITIALTVPLIPVFGALVGRAAGAHAQRRWRALAVLSHHFLDVVSGLPTLKVFGRARAQAASIRAVTGDYRRATMRTLRLAFLSSLVLELVATVSLALVAVGVGLRLVGGHLDLRTGLMVLILAPEAYLPLRQAGALFHASADGLAAAGEAFAVLETPLGGETSQRPPPAAAGRVMPVPRRIRVTDVSVHHPGRPDPAPDRVSLDLAAGQITALAGPSGTGKSTLIAVLLAFAPPASGQVLVEGADGTTAALPDLDPDGWRRYLGWVPQDPVMFPGTVADNIRLGWPDAPPAAVGAAAEAAALREVPLGQRVGERGSGLSSGQRRRVALARALLPGRPVLLLDEPTAGLDASTERRVIATLRREAAAGRAILIAAHRPAVLAAAGTVVQLGRPSRLPEVTRA